MQTSDDTITDFAPPLPDGHVHTYHNCFKYVPAEGSCFADGPSQTPMLDATRLPLLQKREYKIHQRNQIIKERCFVDGGCCCCCVMSKSQVQSQTLLYLRQDSPYTLGGNTRQLLNTARNLGIPRQQTQCHLKGRALVYLTPPATGAISSFQDCEGTQTQQYLASGFGRSTELQTDCSQSTDSLPLDHHQRLVQVCLVGRLEE